MNITRRHLFATAAFAVVLATSHAHRADAADVNVNIGYQPIVEPARVPQADGTYEKVTGAKINWQKFDGGADVIAAIASGSLDIGYVGSSPLAAAASRELPIETIYVVGLISEAEALAVKGIAKPEELAGKKIATPFVSTAHYSLLTALKNWKIDPKTVEILNLRPPEIAAAGSVATSTAPMSGIRFCPNSKRTARCSRPRRMSPSGVARHSTPGSSARSSRKSTPTWLPASSR